MSVGVSTHDGGRGRPWPEHLAPRLGACIALLALEEDDVSSISISIRSSIRSSRYM